MVQRSKNKKKIATLVVSLLAAICVFGGFNSLAYAQQAPPPDDPPKTNYCTPGQPLDPGNPCVPDPKTLPSNPDPAAKQCSGGDCSGLINKYVNPFIRLLGALIGIVVVISLVVGGIQYSASSGDPGKISAAKSRISNSLIALLAYFFLFFFLQWLIPGGIV